YVLLPRAAIAPFIAEMQRYVARRYPDLSGNADYTSIVSAAQYARLTSYVDQARAAGAQIIELAPGDSGKRIFAPTLVCNARDDLALMQEEIFGPVLPLVAADSVEDAVEYVNARPRPLALYHFDNDRQRTRRVLDKTVAGGVSVNDTVMHIAQNDLPFGGIGPSGMGHYHGREGFLTFSKQKPVLFQARISSLKLMRPPYRRIAAALLRFLTR